MWRANRRRASFWTFMDCKHMLNPDCFQRFNSSMETGVGKESIILSFSPGKDDSWKGSLPSWGRDCPLTCELDSSNERHLRMYVPLAFHTRSWPQNTALRQQCGVANLLSGTRDGAQVKPVQKLQGLVGRSRDLLVLTLKVSLAHYTCQLTIWSGLPLSTPSPCPS